MRILLALAGSISMWFFCAPSCAQPKEVVFPKALLPGTVTGHGETVELAKKAAKNKAIGEITRGLKLQAFVLTETYLDKQVVDEGQPGKDVAVDNILAPFKAWEFTFRSDKPWWTDVIRRDHDAQRKLRTDDRLTWTARAVLGLSILLLAGVGYVRLDEYTQGRYTTWLRLAGVSVATTALAGTWWYVVSGQ
ncbi:MAG: hypothetical protein EXR98_15815 [Gemmataceae bacterium]|nr:hypothetical protein [Gemmataceae bacterium]